VAELFLSRRRRGKVARTALIRLRRATLQWHFGNTKKNLFVKLQKCKACISKKHPPAAGGAGSEARANAFCKNYTPM